MLPEARGFSVMEVADGIFVHRGRQEDMDVANGGDIANTGFVVGEASVAVIDPGGSHALARALRRAVGEATALPVSHVVLTHAHPDHVLGAGVFADVPNVVAHARYARAVAARADASNPRYASFLEPGVPVALVPTVELAAGEATTIDLGGRPLRVNALATAHTDDDVVVLDERTRTLWAGDIVFEGRLPSLDGNLSGWLRALDDLGAPEPALVVPGHGAPGRWGPTVTPGRRYLEWLRDDVRERIARGDSLGEAVADAESREDAPPGEPGHGMALYALQNPTNVTRAWVELEWE